MVRIECSPQIRTVRTCKIPTTLTVPRGPGLSWTTWFSRPMSWECSADTSTGPRHSSTPGLAPPDPRTCPPSRATPTFGRRRLSTNLCRRSTRARATPPSWEGEIVMLSKSYYNPEVSFITQAQSQHLPQHPVHREFQHQIRDGRDEPRGARRGRGARHLRSHQGLGHRGSGEKVKILMDQH